MCPKGAAIRSGSSSNRKLMRYQLTGFYLSTQSLGCSSAPLSWQSFIRLREAAFRCPVFPQAPARGMQSGVSDQRLGRWNFAFVAAAAAAGERFQPRAESPSWARPLGGGRGAGAGARPPRAGGGILESSPGPAGGCRGLLLAAASAAADLSAQERSRPDLAFLFPWALLARGPGCHGEGER